MKDLTATIKNFLIVVIKVTDWYREGVGWVYEAPRSKQREAQKDLDTFNRQDRIDDLTGTKDAEKEALQERIDNLDLYIKAL